jgi:F-type H+-transporting ATPase subunit a
MDLLQGLNLPYLLAEASEHAAEGGHEGGHGLSFLGLAVYFGGVLLVIFGLLFYAKKGLGERVFKNKITQWTEQLYLFIENMTVGIIGPHGRKYIPFMMTFWLVIFIANLVSLFFPAAPTSDLSFNLGMALISIGYVQWEGMKSNGVGGHFKHFAGPKLGPALFLITGMIFVIEIVSEIIKNISLSLRIFGNIHGGHEAAEKMSALGVHIGGLAWLNIPFGAFLLPIKLLTCIVQALLFTLLTCVYISLVTHHEDDHGDDHGHDDHAPELAAAH